MTEDQAKLWLVSHLGVSRETMKSLDVFRGFLENEAKSQNLIAASTFDSIWTRHIVDSAQLLTFLPKSIIASNWLDLGSGAGFPGLIAAMLSNYHVTLVESRARRIEYLQRAVAMLDLEGRVTIAGMPLERLPVQEYNIISARAFAPFPKLLQLAARFSTNNTHWLLPKGRNAAKELEEAQENWSLDMRVIPSITDSDAGIICGNLLE